MEELKHLLPSSRSSLDPRLPHPISGAGFFCERRKPLSSDEAPLAVSAMQIPGSAVEREAEKPAAAVLAVARSIKQNVSANSSEAEGFTSTLKQAWLEDSDDVRLALALCSQRSKATQGVFLRWSPSLARCGASYLAYNLNIQEAEAEAGGSPKVQGQCGL